MRRFAGVHRCGNLALMRPRPLLFVLAAAAVVLVSPAARADIPPDPDSPDAHCSQAEQCPNGEFCDYAFSPGAPESEWKHVGEECRTAVQAKGLERRCRDGGNYGGRELFCPPGETGSWSQGEKTSPTPANEGPPAPPKPSGPKAVGKCAIDGGPVLALAWLVLPLALLRRRR